MLNQVFVNRTLNMRKIKFIGLDMDHTLVRYNTKAFEELAHKTIIQKLIKRGYPQKIADLQFDFDTAIRGLIIDKNRGNVLKVSRHGAIRGSRHGTQDIDFQTQQKIYTGTYIDLSASHYSAIDTAFSISVAILFSQLVDLKASDKDHKYPEFRELFDEVIDVMDEAHRDGSLKGIVAKNLDQFIIKEPNLVASLERYKRHDKKLFIVTNSDFHYTKLLLDYAVNPFLKEHESWMDLFHIVVTSAQKPRFFFDNLRFLKVNPKDGSMTNFEDKLTPGIYQGGCASIFEKDFNLSGDDILYVGDHIYGDIVRLKKDCRWRTALVLEELGDEIEKMKLAAPFQNQIHGLMSRKEPLEFDLVEEISKKSEGVAFDDKKVNQLQDKIADLDKEISPLIKKQASIFNPHWGEIMRAGNEESYFAHQVDRFADIYMAKLADLFEYSPRTYFRSRRRPLAHEQALSLVLDQET